jgi:D-isomer specific 2-hydroxyacid dehydrogenase, catalytic domain
VSERPTVLVDFPPLALLKPRLSETHEVRTLWDQPDLDAFLDGPGRKVRVLTGGPGHIENRLIERLPNLGLIARIGTGYDAVDVPFARSRGLSPPQFLRVYAWAVWLRSWAISTFMSPWLLSRVETKSCCSVMASQTPLMETSTAR